ncbi:MAG: hypothetical protein QXW10_03385 [Candidatus Micrarchaeaceae archaeon]
MEGFENPENEMGIEKIVEQAEEAIEGTPIGSDEKLHVQKHEHSGGGVESFAKKHRFYILGIAVIAILVMGVFLRTTMLHFQGFFEPDGFYHYSVMLQAVHDGFAIPLTNRLSGFPTHFPVTEPDGLYYVTLVPYYFLRFFGLSVYDIERGVPVVFGLLDIIATYFIVKRIVNNNYLAVLAMAFVAASGGDIARTAALVYRGDGFITIFLLVALLFIFEALKTDTHRSDAQGLKRYRKYYYMVAAVVVLGIGTVVWNGAPFTIIVYMLAMLFLIIYGFIKANKELLRDTAFMSAALIITYAIQHMWMAAYFIRGNQAFSSWHFFLFYLPITIGSIIAYYVVEKRNSNPILILLAGNAKSRVYLFSFAALIFIALMSTIFYSYLLRIAGGGGLVIAHGALNKSIQELTPPTFGFLWASFNLELLLAPFTLLFYIIFSGDYSLVPVVGMLIGLLLFAAIALYRKKVFTAKHSDEYFIIILAYFAATMYLQANAVRFNSLVAVPIAILSAISIYTIGKFIYDRKVSIYGAFRAINLYYVIVLIIVVLVVYYTYLGSSTFAQADGIDQSFLNATVWMRNNTPANATFLTVWPDGSVIEGWGNRTSLTDSVGGQNGPLIANFSRWLFNDSPDPQYLYSIGKPQYIFTRPYWFTLSGGIAEEGGVNTTGFGLQLMNALQPIYNSTTNTDYYEFISSNIKALLVIHIDANGTKSIGAYVGNPNSTTYDPIDRVLFYDEQSGAFAYSNISDKYVNYTLFVPYMPTTSSVSIGTGILLGPKLLNSNFFKLVMLCTDASSCPYDNSNVTLTPVYVNPDARIYKVTYLNSSNG